MRRLTPEEAEAEREIWRAALDGAAKARKQAQMGNLLGRKPEAERWPRLVCACGEDASSVNEVLLCEHETKAGG